jgi:hypothetical protein
LNDGRRQAGELFAPLFLGGLHHGYLVFQIVDATLGLRQTLLKLLSERFGGAGVTTRNRGDRLVPNFRRRWDRNTYFGCTL